MLVFGALAFVATLYFIGAGFTGDQSANGDAHARGKGLNGYAALFELLDAQGYDVQLSRDTGRLDDESLLVISPPFWTEAEEINNILERRRHLGPTMVILPKWLVRRARDTEEVDARPGWVDLVFAGTPEWAQDLGGNDAIAFLEDRGELAFVGEESAVAPPVDSNARWAGLGIEGRFPRPDAIQPISAASLVPLVTDDQGRMLAGFEDDGGYYPVLSQAAGIEPYDEEDATDYDAWPVVIVAEPDLVNNFGLADRDRAMLAIGLVAATLEDYDMPIVFDVTLNGLGQSENLLTLAFTPPFLAATLCLLIAALVIGWRGYRRFGPPVAEEAAQSFGKRQLATNGAALIQRSKRLHLLGKPYATMMRNRIGRQLGLRQHGNAGRVEADIDRLLAARGLGSAAFSGHAESLRNARTRGELLAPAHALKQIERELSS